MFKTPMLKTLSILLALLLIWLPVGCSHKPGPADQSPREGLHIFTTVSIFADLIENVLGQKGSVDYLVPVGENPEDYELLPGQLQALNSADAVFVNGWGLEEKIEQALGHVGSIPVYYLTEGIKPIPLVGSDDYDPHAWFDPNKTARYVENILEALLELDPEGEPAYRQNSQDYLDRLDLLDAWIREQVEQISEKHRVLVISENALKYFGEAYGFRTEGIWELNAHEEGTPRQIQRIVDLVTEEDIPALFVESTVDRRYMETISRETGVPIAGTIYTDALGPPGGEADTYLGMMRYNMDLFRNGLSCP